MNCQSFNTLLDRYLDDDLSGALRLEFEAHRVSCSACARQISSAQLVGQVLASDADVPPLPRDFASRVMAEVEQRVPRPRAIRFRSAFARHAISAGLGIAATVILFSLSMPSLTPPSSDALDSTDVRRVLGEQLTYLPQQPTPAPDLDWLDLNAAVTARIHDELASTLAANGTLSAPVAQLAGFVNQPLPPELAAQAAQFSQANPLALLGELALGAQAPQDNPTAADATDVELTDGEYSL